MCFKLEVIFFKINGEGFWVNTISVGAKVNTVVLKKDDNIFYNR